MPLLEDCNKGVKGLISVEKIHQSGGTEEMEGGHSFWNLGVLCYVLGAAD